MRVDCLMAMEKNSKARTEGLIEGWLLLSHVVGAGAHQCQSAPVGVVRRSADQSIKCFELWVWSIDLVALSVGSRLLVFVFCSPTRTWAAPCLKKTHARDR